MNQKLEWLYRLGFKSGASYSDALLRDLRVDWKMSLIESEERLLTVPGAAGYIPPLIPTTQHWLHHAQEMTYLSALGLVADIWTQILTLKRDNKEKPIYLLWDGEIPKPTKLTSLMWLLVCEAWPYPNHEPGSNDEAFPAQSFVLPQSTPYGYASVRPYSWTKGLAATHGQALTGLLTQSMHREDRQRMELVHQRTPIHRPQVRQRTSFSQHFDGRSSHNTWSINNGWPAVASKYMDQNIAASQLQDSYYHLEQLSALRANVMRNLITIPALPTCHENLAEVAGLWIRGWSEHGLLTVGNRKPLPWNNDEASVSLGSGQRLKHIPAHAPKVWFGWTHLGPKYEPDPIGTGHKRVITASESWAAAYLEHRPFALRMLFQPETIDSEKLIREATTARGAQLSRAGRINKEGGDSKPSSLSAFADAIKNNPFKGE